MLLIITGDNNLVIFTLLSIYEAGQLSNRRKNFSLNTSIHYGIFTIRIYSYKFEIIKHCQAIKVNYGNYKFVKL